MRFQRVVWHHDHSDEARVWWSETDDAGIERRKVNEFDDGQLEFADETQETEYTVPADGVMPSVVEIDALEEFTAVDVTAGEFQ